MLPATGSVPDESAVTLSATPPFSLVPPLGGESPKGRNRLCFYLMFLSFPVQRYEVMAGPTRAKGLAGETSETFQTPCH